MIKGVPIRVVFWRLLLGAVLSIRPAAAIAQNAFAARIDSLFAAYDRADSPGCALAVYRDGRIAYARGYGKADLQAGVPITTSTVFDIGSTSKQFTAASIVLLTQQGRLSLDDDVRRYIPELPQYQTPITIRHLLHHTSGLRDYIGLMVLGGANTEQHTTAQQALDAITRQKALNFDPGAEHLYSNSGYFLLSQIVERVSGKSMRAFAEEHIFGPLGMRATHFHDDHRMPMPNRATAYEPTASGFRVDMSDWEQTGDGAVNTTVEDLLHWDNNFYQPKVGGQEMLAALHTTGTLNDATSLTYALGLTIGQFRALKTVSHGGAWAGYRADLVRFPEQRLSVATLCNLASANPSALAREVAAVYLEDRLAPVAQSDQPPPATPADTTRVVVPEAELQAWAGTYVNPATGTVRTVTLEDARLFATFGQARRELLPRSAREFIAVIGAATLRLTFERTPDRSARRMRQFTNDRETAVFVEVLNPSAETLQTYAGSYYSEELNTTYTLTVDDGVLQLRSPTATPIPLRALPDHTFSAGGVMLRFATDAQGRSTAFELSQGRVRGITFTRPPAGG